MPKITHSGHGRARIQAHAVWFQSPCSKPLCHITLLVKTNETNVVIIDSAVVVGCGISETCQAVNEQYDVMMAQEAGYEHINCIVIDAMMVTYGLGKTVLGSFYIYIQKTSVR